jgi:PAS domain S-box-containing protein
MSAEVSAANSVSGDHGSVVGPDVFQIVVGHSLDGVIVGIPDGRILYANPAACDIFGASEHELRGIGRQGISDPDHPAWQAMLAERRLTGSTRGIGPMHRLDGTPFLAEVASAIVRLADGEERSCVIVRDVTERELMERNRAAMNDVVQALLVGALPATVLGLVAQHARIIFDATDAAVVTAAEPPADVTVAAADGPRMSTLLGRSYPPGTLSRRVMNARDALVVEDMSSFLQSEEARTLGLGPTIVVPITSGGNVLGVLFVGAARGRRAYTSDDLARATTFAERAGLALTIGEARAETERQERRRADQLQVALDSRIIIEQAKGVLCGVRSISPDEAFSQIRAYARTHNQDIHDVARAIVQRAVRP